MMIYYTKLRLVLYITLIIYICSYGIIEGMYLIYAGTHKGACTIGGMRQLCMVTIVYPIGYSTLKLLLKVYGISIGIGMGTWGMCIV